MLHFLLAESAGHFWQPAEIENVANQYFENIKHLKNPRHLLLTKAIISLWSLYKKLHRWRKKLENSQTMSQDNEK